MCLYKLVGGHKLKCPMSKGSKIFAEIFPQIILSGWHLIFSLLMSFLRFIKD